MPAWPFRSVLKQAAKSLSNKRPRLPPLEDKTDFYAMNVTILQTFQNLSLRRIHQDGKIWWHIVKDIFIFDINMKLVSTNALKITNISPVYTRSIFHHSGVNKKPNTREEGWRTLTFLRIPNIATARITSWIHHWKKPISVKCYQSAESSNASLVIDCNGNFVRLLKWSPGRTQHRASSCLLMNAFSISI